MGEPSTQGATSAIGLELLARGTEHYLAGDGNSARDCLERSLAHARSSGDLLSLADALAILGGLYHVAPFHDLARGYYNTARQLYAELGDIANQGVTAGNLATVEQDSGRLAIADRNYRSAIELCRAAEQPELAAILTGQRATVAHERARLDRAIQLYDRALAALRASDDPRSTALFLAGRGAVAASRGDLDQAATDLTAADNLVRVVDDGAIEGAIWLFTGIHDLAQAERAAASGDGEAAAALTARARSRVDTISAEIATADEARFPLRLLRRALATPAAAVAAPPADLAIDARGRRFSWDGRTADLSRRIPLRRLLQRLVCERLAAPGRLIAAVHLLEAAWPDRRDRRASKLDRVDRAIAELARLGLAPLLVSNPKGYCLAATVGVVVGADGVE